MARILVGGKLLLPDARPGSKNNFVVAKLYVLFYTMIIMAVSNSRHTHYEYWHNMYLHLRNEVQYKTKAAKANYYEAQVEENKNKPTKLWQTLKSLGTSSRSKCNTKNIGLKIDN